MLTLSLFPGIGLLDSAFEQTGYCVVRGPDVIWGGDIRAFHPPAGVFAGVIGGPPCQMFSSLARLVEANGHKTRFGNLIPEFERCVSEAEPDWFLMENVPAAPEPVVAGYSVRSIMLDNSQLAGPDGWGQEQRRLRRFCFGLRGRDAPNLMRWIELATFVLPDPEKCVFGDGRPTRQEKRTRKSTVIARQGTTRPDPKKQPVRHATLHAGHDSPPRTKARTVSNNVGGYGNKPGQPQLTNGLAGRYKLSDALRLQGLPADFLADAPFTADGKLKAVANGVPLPMGLAIARAVRDALAEYPAPVAAADQSDQLIKILAAAHVRGGGGK